MTGDTFAQNAESVAPFRRVMVICAALLAVGGITGAIRIVNPRRPLGPGCAGGSSWERLCRQLPAACLPRHDRTLPLVVDRADMP
jgi:hypothetical protein